MSKRKLLLFMSLVFCLSTIAQNVNIPDANFKAYLISNAAINTNGDTEIQITEANAYTGIIEANLLNILDLTGIEAFIGVTELNCSNNQLNSLDVTSNVNLTSLKCAANQLSSLDVSNNTQLLELRVGVNPLTNLDISLNTMLTNFSIFNCQFATIDVSNNISLIELTLGDNQLTNLDVSQNTNLQELFCANNNLINLDVSQNTNLIYLYCDENSLTNLDVSLNTQLQGFGCSENTLETLDISNGNNSLIQFFNSEDNSNLSCIQIDSGFTPPTNGDWLKDAATIYSDNCQSTCVVNIPDTTLKNILLNIVDINTNGNTEIECSEATSFTGALNIIGGFGAITDYTGLESFTEITQLFISQSSSNTVQALNLTANTKLENLIISSEPFTSIDISTLTSLTEIDITGSSLSTLDISSNTALRDFRLDFGQLNTIDFSGLSQLETIQMTNGQLTSTVFNNNPLLRELILRDNQLSTLNIVDLPLLEFLEISSNVIGTLNVSQNTNLEVLRIGNNALNTVDTTQNSILTSLTIGDNNLSTLDLSQNISLDSFELSGNQNLMSLDLSNNGNLFSLNIFNSAFTTLNLSSNGSLGEAYIFSNPNLASINIANGNNANIIDTDFTNNTNLTCIQIDSGFTPPSTWFKDAGTIYSDNCAAATCVVSIPDANFKSTLVNNSSINSNGDTEIQCDEAATYTGVLNLSNDNITSLQGVEAFISATEINFSSNSISSADFSFQNQFTNIGANNNNTLSSLDVSGCSQLEILNINQTDLTTIDTSNNLQLRELFGVLSEITTLDLSANSLLESVYLEDTNLQNIDLSNNPSLLNVGLRFTNLQLVDMANGFNSNIISFDARNNNALSCIQIDTGFTIPTDNSWRKPSTANYSDNCANLSIDTFNSNDFKIYPNPVTDILNIETNKTIISFEVYSIMGKKILESNTKSVNVSNLGSGVYFIKIGSEKGSVTKRFIKN